MLVRAAIEFGNLLEVVWVSITAGAVVTTLFSLVVLAGEKSAQARRAGAGTAALGYLTLAALSFLGFAAVVGFGVQIMLSKG